MARIYLPASHIKGNLVSITGEKARYLRSVTRCSEGDILIVFDGEGNCFRTKVANVGSREVLAEIERQFPCDVESPVHFTLGQGLLKGEKMDLVVQKTTELGVNEIRPVITDRSQLRETRKISRWRKIVQEAARQSGRSVVPVVHEAVNLTDFLNSLPEGILQGIVFYEEGGLKVSDAFSSFGTKTSSLVMLVGPEGGFTRGEIAAAEGKGFLIATLGKRILRAETAAIAAAALVQFQFGGLE
ncbi:MAG: 16S rRNA (uracil(1498)-N(3))-methyltransferase [Nitrospirota bacterium]